MNFNSHELLAMTERALERLDWGQVYALASAVLVLEPDNAEAGALRALAERRGGANSLPGRRQATALFIDLVDSTPVAERYDVEIYSEVLHVFEQACRPAIENHDGHFVDIQGDAILACFGYPSGHEDDACRAVSAALDMLAALRPVAADLSTELGIQLRARIGIDTGIVVIDGATVHGPALNRAARLQSLAAPDTVLITAATNELVAERFETVPLGPRTLKGIETPVEIFEVTGPRRQAGQDRALRSTALPLIGRDTELGQVLELWASTVTGARVNDAGRRSPDAAVVLLTGEPGIGKSRLVSAVVDGTAGDGAQSVEMYCSSYSVTSTLFPLRTAVERYADLGSARTDGERLDKLEAALAGLPIDLAEIIPTLGVLLDLDLAGRYPAIELAPIQLREFLLDRLVALLRAYGSDRPVVMVFEDLQWADPTTLELLDRMARAGVPAGLLILATARPDLEWTPSHSRVLRIRLDPLSTVHARQLAFAAAPGQLSEGDAREIAVRGDGVPLFVEQLAHAMGSGIGAARCDVTARMLCPTPSTSFCRPGWTRSGPRSSSPRWPPLSVGSSTGRCSGRSWPRWPRAARRRSSRTSSAWWTLVSSSPWSTRACSDSAMCSCAPR